MLTLPWALQAGNENGFTVQNSEAGEGYFGIQVKLVREKKNITFWCRSIYLAWQLWIIVFQDLQIVKRNPFIPHGLFHSSECSNRQMLSWFNRHSSNIKYNFSFDSLREYLQDVHFLNKSNLIQIIISQ